MLSGSVFGVGTVYFLWLPVRGAAAPRGWRLEAGGRRKGGRMPPAAAGMTAHLGCAPSPLPLSQRERGLASRGRGADATRYFIAAGGAIVLLQVIVRIDAAGVGTLVTALALAGVAIVPALAIAGALAILVRRAGREPA